MSQCLLNCVSSTKLPQFVVRFDFVAGERRTKRVFGSAFELGYTEYRRLKLTRVAKRASAITDLGRRRETSTRVANLVDGCVTASVQDIESPGTLHRRRGSNAAAIMSTLVALLSLLGYDAYDPCQLVYQWSMYCYFIYHVHVYSSHGRLSLALVPQH